MTARTATLIAVLALIALLGYLTISVLVRHGFDPLIVLSFLILVLFAVGIVGALTERPPE